MQAVGKIAVIIPKIVDMLDKELLNGIFHQASLLGYDVLVLTGTYNLDTSLTQALDNIYKLIYSPSISGVIFAAGRFQDEPRVQRIFKNMKRLTTACVVLEYQTSAYPYVYAP